MARALLDINVVIALLDQGHVLHRAAFLWLDRELGHGWATCPLGTAAGPARQITDVYLLALATTHGGRFVTPDQRVGVEVVPAASAANLSIIEPVHQGVV